MEGDKFFYALARVNILRPSGFEYFKILDHIMYGTLENAEKLLEFANDNVYTDASESPFKIYKVELTEL